MVGALRAVFEKMNGRHCFLTGTVTPCRDSAPSVTQGYDACVSLKNIDNRTVNRGQANQLTVLLICFVAPSKDDDGEPSLFAHVALPSFTRSVDQHQKAVVTAMAVIPIVSRYSRIYTKWYFTATHSSNVAE